MKLKEKISINDFDSQDKDADVYSQNIKKAVITHYLHNLKNGVKKYFEKDAKKYLGEFFDRVVPDLYEGKVTKKDLERRLCLEVQNVPFPNDDFYTFKFIDLFAGIGGFRIAMQNLGGKCVFSSEWDKYSQITYKANFGEVPFGDLTKEETKKHIPCGFDILCAGFPCQAFSIAGKKGGFEDTRGTLFFDVAEILRRHKPQAFFLENVKGLVGHDKGRTLKTILNVLRNDLDYYVPEPEIINAKNFGVPQNRERIFIVGFRRDLKITGFKYPELTDDTKTFAYVKEENVVPVRYYMSTQYLDTLRKHRARHEAKGNGFGYQIIKDNEIANAIVVGGMGRERNLVLDDRLEDFTPETKIKGEVNREGIRRMTPREWARLQGFPDKFIIDAVADVHLYKQFGNSVAIPAIQATAEKIIETLGDKL